jgi:rubrerythrin
MDVMEKLGKLIPHWMEHNEEHARSYLRWAEEAEAAGFRELARILKKVHEETVKINDLFEEAGKEVRKRQL